MSGTNIQQRKNGTFENMGRRIDNSIENTKTQINRAKEAGVNAIRSGQREATRIANNIANSAKKTAANARDFAAQQINSARNIIRSNYNTLREKSKAVARDAQEVLNKAGNLSEKAAYTLIGVADVIGEKVKNVAISVAAGVMTVTLVTGEVIRINIVRPAINSVNAARNIVRNAYNSVKKQAKMAADSTRQAITRLENSINKAAVNALNSTKRRLTALWEAGSRTYAKILSNVKAAGNRGMEVAVASAQAVRDYGNRVVNASVAAANNTVVVVLTTGEKVSYEVNTGLRTARRKAVQTQQELEQRGRAVAEDRKKKTATKQPRQQQTRQQQSQHSQQ